MVVISKGIQAPLWERACSRMRCISQCICKLIHRIREQARSHIF